MNAEAMRWMFPMTAKHKAATLVESSLGAYFAWAMLPLAVSVEAMSAAAQTLQSRVFYSGK